MKERCLRLLHSIIIPTRGSVLPHPRGCSHDLLGGKNRSRDSRRISVISFADETFGRARRSSYDVHIVPRRGVAASARHFLAADRAHGQAVGSCSTQRCGHLCAPLSAEMILRTALARGL